jgi:hypothetical protein
MGLSLQAFEASSIPHHDVSQDDFAQDGPLRGENLFRHLAVKAPVLLQAQALPFGCGCHDDFIIAGHVKC